MVLFQFIIRKTKEFQSGQSLVELLVAIGLSAILLPAFILAVITGREGKAQQNQRLDAVTLLKETETIVRNIRESGWLTFAVDGIYHPVQNGSAWTLASGSDTVNGLTRSVVIGDVYRNSSGAIVTSGGILDPSTKMVTTTISWSTPSPSSITSLLYLTRYLKNGNLNQTTVGDFTSGGSTATGAADWCKPNLSITSLDLPGQGITTAISAATTLSMDYAYTTTGGNASGDSMDSVSITHDTPPVSTNTGVYNNYKTYGIFVDSLNQYVYLTSDHPGLTVDIVQVSSKPYTEVGTFAASGGNQGSSVFVANNPNFGADVGYVTAGNNLYTFDLSSKNGSRAQLGSIALPGTGKKILIVGNYAYVVTGSTTEQLDIFDITNPRSLTKVSKINLGNNQSGVDVFVNSVGTRAYVVTSQGSPNVSDFFIVDTSNKTTTLPTPLGSFNTGSMNPTGVTVVQGGLRAIIVGSGGEQYKVLDLSSESSPSRCGGITNPNGTTAINAVGAIQRRDGSAYSYFLTNTASAEFQLIAGGPGQVINYTGTQIVPTDGSSLLNDAQVQLDGGGATNWCKPQSNIISSLTLPKIGNTLVATVGAAFIGTGDGTNGTTFVKTNITDPDPPPGSPVASIASTYSSTYKTNAVYSDGHYAYLAVDGSSSQVVILDISTTPYTKIGWIDLPSGQPANGVYVQSNTAYVTSSNTLYSYDVTNKANGHSTPLGYTTMWAGLGATPVAKQVYVNGNYVFVGAANTAFGLQKFLIQLGATYFRLVGVSNLTWTQNAQGLYVNSSGTRAYIAFDSGTGPYTNGMYIVDTSPADPPSWWELPNYYDIDGTYNAGSTDPRGIALAPGNHAILVGTGGTQQYQVINISNETNPIECGSLAISSGINGVAPVVESDGDSYAYIITGEATNQFKIIQGGYGGASQLATSGTFESVPFYLSTPSAIFNNFYADIAQPPQTSLKLQVAVAPAISGSCANSAYTYVGPGGNAAAYFTTTNSASISGAIPLGTVSPNYINPAECLKYKAYLSTNDVNLTPILYDMNVNFSP